MKHTGSNCARAAAVVTGLAAAALATVATTAFAQNYPNRPVRLLVGFVPGGSTDLAGRFIAQKLGELFGQQVIVENRPGAGTALANERAATAPPDGYTLLLMTASLSMAEAGKVRLLAVTSAKRSALKPEIPTVSESGLPGYDRSSWNGLMGPSAMPKEIVTQLQAAMEKILNHPQAREQLMKIGLEPNYLPGDQFGAYLRDEVAQISQLMKSIAFKTN